MSKPPTKPIEPLTILKGVGYAGRRNNEKPRRLPEGEKALGALDTIMTDSMRRIGVLPELEPITSAKLPLILPPNIAEYDVMKLPVWTLLMALAWIATRNMETVTWQRDDWRRENGLPEGSLPTVSISAGEGIESDNDGDPTAFRALEAFDQLKTAGEGGNIVVRAMAVDRDEPTVLRPLDWTYGALSFDRQLDEVWRVGRERYYRLTVERDHLLQVFPPNSEISVPALLDADASPPKAARGAPGKYAWGQFQDECQRLWDENGGFSDDDPVFSRQGHLVDLMETWCIDQTAKRRDGWPRVPSRSQLKEHVKAFLTSLG